MLLVHETLKSNLHHYEDIYVNKSVQSLHGFNTLPKELKLHNMQSITVDWRWLEPHTKYLTLFHVKQGIKTACLILSWPNDLTFDGYFVGIILLSRSVWNLNCSAELLDLPHLTFESQKRVIAILPREPEGLTWHGML